MTTPTRINKLKSAMQGMAAAPVLATVPSSGPPVVRAAVAPSRRGKRVVSAYVEAAAAKQLRLLAVDRDASTQSLLEEALNDLFRKYNRSAVA